MVSIRKYFVGNISQSLLGLTLFIALFGIPPTATSRNYEMCAAAPPFAIAPIFEGEREPGDTDIEANDVEYKEDQLIVLKGDAVIAQDDWTVVGDEIRYSEQTRFAEAAGGVRLWQDGSVFASSEFGDWDIDKEVRTLENVDEYRLIPQHAQGKSKLARFGSEHYYMEGISYSTCNANDQTWFVEADRLEIDKPENEGRAYNAWLHVKDVPVFYTPYISFPLTDERKSGLLVPSFGASDETGFEVTVPYYFNIAPNMDATLGVRGMTTRGVQIQGEYRYLFPWGSGKFASEIIPYDPDFEDLRMGVSARHSGYFQPNWYANLHLDWVSDKEYFEQLGTQLSVSSQSQLEQRADLGFRSEDYFARLRVKRYQTVDRTIERVNRPYKQYPQFTFGSTLAEKNRSLNVNGQGEWVYFDHDEKVDGWRADLEPTISLPYRTPGTFFVPSASLRFTAYNLNNVSANQDDSFTRTIPTLSLDSGLIFDRSQSLFGDNYTHTFEPRLFYLFTPYDEQEDIPLFDSAEYTFAFDQLFRRNRFSGADRVADANQLSVAVTSRLISDQSGEELARFSLGQIRYFRDRKVRLSETEPVKGADSPIIANLGVNFNRQWRGTGEYHWDYGESRTDRATASLSYQPAADTVVNASYRFVRGTSKQTDLSFAVPISPRLRAVGRWNYSIDNRTSLETFGGFEYESCCWSASLLYRRFINNIEGDFNNAVFFQLQMKGLAGFGNANAFLRENLRGYEKRY